jgi:lysophospholipase L1-like esterase
MRLHASLGVFLVLAFPALLAAQGMVPATTRPDGGRFHPGLTFAKQQKQIAELNGECDLIFLGDSITEKWDRELWSRHYAPRRAFNYGISGDTTQALLHRLDNPALKSLRPKVAVVLIGTNNVSNSAEDIAAGVAAVVNKTRAIFPGVRVILLDILPNGRRTELMAEANRLISANADGEAVHHLDLAPLMVPENGNWRGLDDDRLHLAREGYRIWHEAMEPLLARLLEEAAR